MADQLTLSQPRGADYADLPTALIKVCVSYVEVLKKFDLLAVLATHYFTYSSLN